MKKFQIPNSKFQIPRYNCGFTLVELAIVIVIIGLLVGGVVGGASLIESAKLKSIISDIDKYKTAINAFKLEYDALPGDMRDATDYWGSVSGNCLTVSGTGTQTCDGDGDKAVDYVHTTHSNTLHESWRAWQHLTNAEIITGMYTGVSIAGSCPLSNFCSAANINTPESSLSNTSWHLFTRISSSTAIMDSWGTRNGDALVLYLGNPRLQSGHGNNGVWYGPSLSPKQAKSIDKKIDDSLPRRGTISSPHTSTAYHSSCMSGTGVEAVYNLSETRVICGLFADID